MPYDPERDGELRAGASPDPDDWVAAGPDAPGVSPAQVRRIADAIMEDERLTGGVPSTAPLKPGVRSGIPQGYGKWGDLA
jgi:CTP:molybdopterin cytidylyltransferase MocA